jgi:hypothetical protein
VRVAPAKLPARANTFTQNRLFYEQGRCQESGQLEPPRNREKSRRRTVRLVRWKCRDITTLGRDSPVVIWMVSVMEDVEVNNRWKEKSRVRVKES